MNKILVVDDDADILAVVELILSANNFKVKTISHWEDISRSIQIYSPDLILVDVSLGGADGRAICTALKNSVDAKHIPVILFSAQYDLVNNMQGCMANGMVAKPFETSYLLETIRKNIA